MHRRNAPGDPPHHRSPSRLRPRPRGRPRATAIAAAAVLVAACTTTALLGDGRLVSSAARLTDIAGSRATPVAPGRAVGPRPVRTATGPSPSPVPAAAAEPPGIGPAFAARIPADSSQLVVAYGDAVNSSDTTVVFYQKTDNGWQPVASWPGHNGDKGWTAEHRQGDLKTPIGVFGLTDAGGRLANPGSQLPYHRSGEFVDSGVGFNGESLADAFDYVIAVNYNRVAGSSPLDGREPMGYAQGGGIWLHVDHGGPTHACVSIPAEGMVTLLRELSPDQHPVIVMGDRADLAR